MAFDPYHRWLGIPAKEQPPNHYRLLAITLFEDNPDVIEAAADRQMLHLRNYQSGKYSELSQQLLNEVSAARVCLLNPKKKAAYDKQLRQENKAHQKPVPKAVPIAQAKPQPVAQPAVFETPQQPADSGLTRLYEKTHRPGNVAASQRSMRRHQTQITATVALLLVGLIAGIAIVVVANRSGPTRLALEWPEAQRHAAVLQIDGRRYDVPPGGALEYPLSAGEHRLTAVRPGYAPYAERFTLADGQSLILQPKWREIPPEKEKPVVKKVPPKPEVVQEKPKPTPKPEAVVAEPEEPKILPVPPEAERQKVVAQMTELFSLSKERTPDERKALSGELAALADKATSKTERYVLLDTAARLACQGGDADAAFRRVDDLAEAFDVDPLEKRKALVLLMAEGARDSADVAALLATADRVIDKALAEHKYPIALELADEAYKVCALSAGREYRKQAFDRRKEVQGVAASWQELQEVLGKLQANPDDPEANLVAARYWCFDRQDWQQGLKHLAKSSDEGLKELAAKEVAAPPGDATAMIALADDWWTAAQSRQDRQHDAIMLHAGSWYREALPDVTSTLVKAKVEKRLEEIEKLGQPIVEPAPAEAVVKEAFPRAQWVDILPMAKIPDDVVKGDWIRSESDVTVRSGQFAQLWLPVLIDGEYDLRYEFTRTDGAQAVPVTFPLGDRSCALILSSQGGSHHWLFRIGNQDQDKVNPTKRTPGTLVNGRRHQVLLSVRREGQKAQIAATLNGTPLLEWEGDLAQLRTYMESRPRQISLGGHDSPITYHKVQLRMVSGTATRPAEPSFALP